MRKLATAASEEKISREIFGRTFKAVCTDVVQGFQLPENLEKYNRQPSSYGDPYQLTLSVDKHSSLDADDLIAFHRTCVELDTGTQLATFLEKLQLESTNVGIAYFHAVVFPYLSVVPSLHIDLRAEQYHNLFTKILTDYVTRFVQMEPAKPRGWKKAKRGCWCEDCKQLDDFLVSPTRRVAEFTLSDGRRRHIEDRMRCSQTGSGLSERAQAAEFSITTSRTMAPYILKITKRDDRYDDAYRAWAKRAEQARERILNIAPEPELRILLGGNYDDIVHMDAIKQDQQAEEAQVAPPESYSSRLNRPLQSMPNVPAQSRQEIRTNRDDAKRKEGPTQRENEPKSKRSKLAKAIDISDLL